MKIKNQEISMLIIRKARTRYKTFFLEVKERIPDKAWRTGKEQNTPNRREHKQRTIKLAAWTTVHL
jgi:hypothetical protein